MKNLLILLLTIAGLANGHGLAALEDSPLRSPDRFTQPPQEKEAANYIPANRFFSLSGRTYGEEIIIPDTVETCALGGTYIQIEEFPNRGWIADREGYFKIDSLPSGEYHLSFSYIGLEASDTIVQVTPGLQPLRILLSLPTPEIQAVAPLLNVILSQKDEKQISRHPFWNKYGLRMAFYTQENLQKGIQRLDATGYSYHLTRNQRIFDYLDQKYGYNWRFDAPKGIIGLDETLNLPLSFDILTP